MVDAWRRMISPLGHGDTDAGILLHCVSSQHRGVEYGTLIRVSRKEKYIAPSRDLYDAGVGVLLPLDSSQERDVKYFGLMRSGRTEKHRLVYRNITGLISMFSRML